MKTQIMLVQVLNCILITSLLTKETRAKPKVILNPDQDLYEYPEEYGDHSGSVIFDGIFTTSDNSYISTSTDEPYLEESTSPKVAPKITELTSMSPSTVELTSMSASTVVTTEGKSWTVAELMTSAKNSEVPSATESSIFEVTSDDSSGRADGIINSSATTQRTETTGALNIDSQQKKTTTRVPVPGSYSGSNYQLTTLHTSDGTVKHGQSSSKSTEIPSTSASKTTPVSKPEPESAKQSSSTTTTTTTSTTTTKSPPPAVSKIPNESPVKLTLEGKLELELSATVLFQILSMMITRPAQQNPSPALTVEQILELASLLKSKSSDVPCLNPNQAAGAPLINSLAVTKTETDEPVSEVTTEIQHTPLSDEKVPTTPKYTTDFVNIKGRSGTGTSNGRRFGFIPNVSNGQLNYKSFDKSRGSRLKLGKAVIVKNSKNNM